MVAVDTQSHVYLSGVLSEQQNSALLQYAIVHQTDFTRSTVSTNAPEYRKSLVLHNVGEWGDLIREKVRSHLPEVADCLGLEVSPATIECQITATGHCEYFKTHNDSGSPDTCDRVISYVYYFHCQPKPYIGGQLRIYEGNANGYYEDIEPANGAIVFFPSRVFHEVLPVIVKGAGFERSRFTLNGWVRSANI